MSGHSKNFDALMDLCKTLSFQKPWLEKSKITRNWSFRDKRLRKLVLINYFCKLNLFRVKREANLIYFQFFICLDNVYRKLFLQADFFYIKYYCPVNSRFIDNKELFFFEIKPINKFYPIYKKFGMSGFESKKIYKLFFFLFHFDFIN